MVTFSCDGCGDSVKKNQVANHLQRCWSSSSGKFSCIDCNKDFWGAEYMSHIECVTENERYGGKDYVQKASANKGKKKQDEWIDNIRKLLDKKDLKKTVLEAITHILEFPNIPRKQEKFSNFMSNCLRNKSPQLVKEVWEAISVRKDTKEEKKEQVVPAVEKKEMDPVTLETEVSMPEEKKFTEGENGNVTNEGNSETDVAAKLEKKSKKHKKKKITKSVVEESKETENSLEPEKEEKEDSSALAKTTENDISENQNGEQPVLLSKDPIASSESEVTKKLTKAQRKKLRKLKKIQDEKSLTEDLVSSEVDHATILIRTEADQLVKKEKPYDRQELDMKLSEKDKSVDNNIESTYSKEIQPDKSLLADNLKDQGKKKKKRKRNKNNNNAEEMDQKKRKLI